MAVKGSISCVIETFGWRAEEIILLFCEDVNLNPWNPHKSWTLQQLQLKGGRWRQEDSPKLEGQLTWCTSQLWTTKSTCLKQGGRGWLIPKVGLQHLYTWVQKDKQRIKKWIWTKMFLSAFPKRSSKDHEMICRSVGWEKDQNSGRSSYQHMGHKEPSTGIVYWYFLKLLFMPVLGDHDKTIECLSGPESHISSTPLVVPIVLHLRVSWVVGSQP